MNCRLVSSGITRNSITLFTLTLIKYATFSFQSAINHIITNTVRKTTYAIKTQLKIQSNHSS